MKKTIGIIGSGMIGAQVARLSVNAGINVRISNSRGPASLNDLVAEFGPLAKAATVEDAILGSDIVVLAVPFKIYSQLPVELLAGKIVIDTMNYYPERDGTMPEVKTDEYATSELVQKHLSESFVIRAINNLDFIRLGRLARASGSLDRSAMPVAGNEQQSKTEVINFLNAIGYDAVDMGALSESWRSEPTMPVYVVPYVGEQPANMPSSQHWFFTSQGVTVSKQDVTALLGNAIRHDKMFGDLGLFA